MSADINDEYLDELIEIQNSQIQQQLFKTTSLAKFWCQQLNAYPRISKKAIQILLPFVTTYLCEQTFSRMVDIKNKKRSTLNCEDDLRVAVSNIKPRIDKIVSEKKQQQSH